VHTGKLILRDYVKATVEFEELGADRHVARTARNWHRRVGIRVRLVPRTLSRLIERKGRL
jgi:hypothetical protein